MDPYQAGSASPFPLGMLPLGGAVSTGNRVMSSPSGPSAHYVAVRNPPGEDRLRKAFRSRPQLGVPSLAMIGSNLQGEWIGIAVPPLLETLNITKGLPCRSIVLAIPAPARSTTVAPRTLALDLLRCSSSVTAVTRGGPLFLGSLAPHGCSSLAPFPATTPPTHEPHVLRLGSLPRHQVPALAIS
jgi:hypothetical protein